MQINTNNIHNLDSHKLLYEYKHRGISLYMLVRYSLFDTTRAVRERSVEGRSLNYKAVKCLRALGSICHLIFTLVKYGARNRYVVAVIPGSGRYWQSENGRKYFHGLNHVFDVVGSKNSLPAIVLDLFRYDRHVAECYDAETVSLGPSIDYVSHMVKYIYAFDYKLNKSIKDLYTSINQRVDLPHSFKSFRDTIIFGIALVRTKEVLVRFLMPAVKATIIQANGRSAHWNYVLGKKNIKSADYQHSQISTKNPNYNYAGDEAEAGNYLPDAVLMWGDAWAKKILFDVPSMVFGTEGTSCVLPRVVRSNERVKKILFISSCEVGTEEEFDYFDFCNSEEAVASNMQFFYRPRPDLSEAESALAYMRRNCKRVMSAGTLTLDTTPIKMFNYGEYDVYISVCSTMLVEAAFSNPSAKIFVKEGRLCDELSFLSEDFDVPVIRSFHEIYGHIQFDHSTTPRSVDGAQYYENVSCGQRSEIIRTLIIGRLGNKR